MAGRDDETRIVPPEPDATQLVQSGADAPTILNTPETMISGSQGSTVSRPISPSLAQSRGARASASVPGTRLIGDYEIESEIARGGMGVVYKARQLSLNRPVAFKMILAGQFASAADVERFHVEAEAAAALDHPNIVSIYEVGVFESNHFFTMKFIDGTSMAHEMPRLVKTPRDGVRLLVKVCRAIHYAHQHSILHRDLKPANILLDAQGEPHVTDFGLAKRTEGDSQLTQTGAIVGTPSYMSPEQAKPSTTPLTTAADVYSLGAILYEVLTGRPPFRGNSPLDTVMLVLNKEAERPRSINAGADRDLETIALKCLEKDPARRYGSAEALAEDLDRWLNNEPILARPIGTPERMVKWAKRRPAIAAMAAAVAIATIAGVAGVVWQWREAVFQRGQTAEALIQLAATAHETELARDKEAAQRAAAEAAQAQETIQRKTADEQRGIAVNALDSLGRYQYLNNVTLADHEWTANNIGHVDQLLAASPAVLRNWEWNYLTRLTHMETTALAVPGGSVIALAVGPDGVHATTISSDLSASLWDLRTHRQIRSVKLDGVPGLEFGSSALSVDGSTFMTSIQRLTNGTLLEESAVWDTTTGRALWKTQPSATIQTFTNFTAAALNPDGTRLITASTELAVPASVEGLTPAQVQAAAAQAVAKSNSRLRIRNARTGAELPSPGVLPGRISLLAVSPDGSLLVAGSRAATPGSPPATDSVVVDLASGKTVATLNHSVGASAVFSPDGRFIAASVPAGIRLWSSSGGDERWSWAATGAGTPVFSPGGRLLVAALADRSIRVLDAAAGQEMTRFTGNTTTANSVAFAGTETDIISADSGTLRLFAIPPPPPSRVGEGTAETALSAGVTPDGRLLMVGRQDGGMKSWDLETGRLLFSSPVATPVAMNPLAMMTQASPLNSRLVFSGDGQRTARVTTAMVDAGSGRAEMRTALRFRDTRTGEEVWHSRTSDAARELAAPEFAKALQSGVALAMPFALGLDTTGSRAALATMRMAMNSPGPSTGGAKIIGSEITLWGSPADRPAVTINLPSTMVVSLELSPDGRRLAVLAGAYTEQGPVAAEYRVYDAVTGRFLQSFRGAKEAAPIVFSRDGRLLAAETARHTVTIWDLDQGGRALALPEHSSAVTRLAFSPDGTRLASLSGQGITLFDVRSGNQLLVLRESNGPFSVREFIAPGRLAGGGTTIRFSADGNQIIQTIVSSDPRGIKVQTRMWDGSPVAKR